MTLSEFRAIFAEVTGVYGEKAYPLAMGQKLFHTVSKVDSNDFRRVVDNVIMEHNRPPPIGIFAKACFPFLRDAAAREQRKSVSALEARQRRCQHCDNTALVFVFDRANIAHEYAFKCLECDAHQVRKVGRGIPVWRSEFASQYLTLAEKVGIEKADRAAKTLVDEAERRERRAAIAAEIEQLRGQGAAKSVDSENYEWGF